MVIFGNRVSCAPRWLNSLSRLALTVNSWYSLIFLLHLQSAGVIGIVHQVPSPSFPFLLPLSPLSATSWDRASLGSFGWLGTQAGLKLRKIYLPPKCWYPFILTYSLRFIHLFVWSFCLHDVYAPHAFLVPTKARTGCQIPGPTWLLATFWVLGPRPSGRVTSVLNFGTSLQPP